MSLAGSAAVGKVRRFQHFTLSYQAGKDLYADGLFRNDWSHHPRTLNFARTTNGAELLETMVQHPLCDRVRII